MVHAWTSGRATGHSNFGRPEGGSSGEGAVVIFSSRSATLRRRRIALNLPGGSDSSNGAPTSDGVIELREEATAPVIEAVVEPLTADPPVLPEAIVALPRVAEPPVPLAPPAVLTISVVPPEPVDPDWEPLSSLLVRLRPLVWLFAGTRAETTDHSLIVGERFATRWRSESARQTDIIIDSTCPETSLTHLWTNLSERVLRFRPDVAFLWIGELDARRGMTHLSKFERQLEAIITRLQQERILPLLMVAGNGPASDPHDIDGQVYAEAVTSIAKERDVPVLSGTAVENPQAVADRLCRGILSAAETAVGDGEGESTVSRSPR